MDDTRVDRAAWNGCRYVAGGLQGHYESWFQRANHPTRPLAFWIRYTIFSPAGRPHDAVGELWAVYFDGERGSVAAAKQDVAIADCRFATSGIDVRIGEAMLTDTRVAGRLRSGGTDLAWDLAWSGGGVPLLLLPRPLYERGFPKAKALVGTPGARFDGRLVAGGSAVEVDGWIGSQNHNWGSRHTDSYAWGQVAGFDDAPDVFLECSTAQVKVGPLWTPRLSLVVLRVGQEEIALNGLAQALRAEADWGWFDWRIRSASAEATVTIHVHAPREAFVGLTYRNPPGGSKTCLNSKLASCELRLEQGGLEPRTWTTRHRAAFEILTDRTDHGVRVAV